MEKGNNKSSLGNILRLLRIANDLSAKELSVKMGVSPTYISEVEANNKQPSLEMLSKYSKALNVSKSSILYFEEEEDTNQLSYQELLFLILDKMIDKKRFKQ